MFCQKVDRGGIQFGVNRESDLIEREEVRYLPWQCSGGQLSVSDLNGVQLP